MLHGRVAEVVAVSALAAIITVVIAAPVLRAPSERIFGMELVGRHHDPFTVMRQFEAPITGGVYWQPVTDLAGALLSRVSGPVAAYNWLVLLSFPLSAAAAFLLARRLALAPLGATVAALAFAFSPFHLAQAAYHPHIAQTQWVPLYLLALWGCLDRATPVAVGFLTLATAAVTLSNFYGGLIAAAITPIAIGAHWLVFGRRAIGAAARVAIAVGTLSMLAVAGLGYVWWAAPSVLADAGAFANPRGDAFRYSADWRAYLVPPVAHPLVGAPTRQFWADAGVRDGLLEQQVALGYGVIALALIGAGYWFARDRRGAAAATVPVLAVVGAAALLCSLSPVATIAGVRFPRPSAALQEFLPMFRAYARFGVVVQLMAALLAGIGVDHLRRSATTRARLACALLLALAAGEYTVSPGAMWRDVLPTTAHRWVMNQSGATRVRALDCTPLNSESGSVQWLTNDRVRPLASPVDDCAEPHVSRKAAATGYTHLLVRHTAARPSWPDRPAAAGLRRVARFDDGEVFAVTAAMPAIYTGAMPGFFDREHDAEWTWRWMGHDASWTVMNTGAQPIVATLQIELSAFHRARRLEVRLNGRPVQTLLVEPPRSLYQIGPVTFVQGGHQLQFHPTDAPAPASDVIDGLDRRPLSFAVGSWNWIVRGEQP